MSSRLGTLWRTVATSAIATILVASPGFAQRAASTRPTADSPPSKPSATRQAVPRGGGEPAVRTPSNRHPRRSAPVHRSGRHYPRYFYGPHVWWGGGFGYYGSYGWRWGFAPHYGNYWPVVPTRARAALADLGGLDLNVRPKKTEVYVDGVLVGKAGRYDGFPGHLWLESGVHELVFHMPGYQTVSRRVTVPPGALLDLRLRLEPGETTPPEEVIARRPTPSPAPRAVERSAAPSPGAGESASLDLRAEPGRFRLVVEPGDASIYLDGRFLGTGDELERLHAGLMVDPGSHELQVVRPGYRPRSETLAVESGQELALEIVLEAEAGS